MVLLYFLDLNIVVMKFLLFIGRVFTIAVGIASECMLYNVENEGHSLFMYSQRII